MIFYRGEEQLPESHCSRFIISYRSGNKKTRHSWRPPSADGRVAFANIDGNKETTQQESRPQPQVQQDARWDTVPANVLVSPQNVQVLQLSQCLKAAPQYSWLASPTGTLTTGNAISNAFKAVVKQELLARSDRMDDLPRMKVDVNNVTRPYLTNKR